MQTTSEEGVGRSPMREPRALSLAAIRNILGNRQDAIERERAVPLRSPASDADNGNTAAVSTVSSKEGAEYRPEAE